MYFFNFMISGRLQFNFHSFVLRKRGVNAAESKQTADAENSLLIYAEIGHWADDQTTVDLNVPLISQRSTSDMSTDLLTHRQTAAPILNRAATGCWQSSDAMMAQINLIHSNQHAVAEAAVNMMQASETSYVWSHFYAFRFSSIQETGGSQLTDFIFWNIYTKTRRKILLLIFIFI